MTGKIVKFFPGRCAVFGFSKIYLFFVAAIYPSYHKYSKSALSENYNVKAPNKKALFSGVY